MPNRVVKHMNEWGKSKRGVKYLDRVQFLNRKKQLVEWENKELRDTLPEIEDPIYPNLMAEIPGVVLKSDLEDVGDAVATPPPPA